MVQPALAAWFDVLAARLARNDHAGAMAFLVEHSSELLETPGGPDALVTFLAQARGNGDSVDAWSLLESADLEPLISVSREPFEHALAVYASVEFDRGVAACELCEAATDDPRFSLARAGHHLVAGRFTEVLAEVSSLRERSDRRVGYLADMFAARAILRMGDPIAGLLRLEAIEVPAAGLGALVEVHRLRALLSAGTDLERVYERSAELSAPESPTIVRELARRLHGYASVLTGRHPGRLTFEAGPEAHLDAAEIASLAGDPTAVAPILAIASSCSRDGRRYLEARARIVAAIASFAEGTLGARRRAEQEIERARQLCDTHGYQHLAGRCDLVLAISAERSHEPNEHLRRLETVLERSTTMTVFERLAETVLHRRSVDQLEVGDSGLLDLLGFAHLPAFSVDDGSGARLVGELDLERWRGRADLVVDLDRHELIARGKVIRGQARIMTLLVHLITAGPRPMEADELFRTVWNARVYAPLRHRNAVYLAISRTRRLLSPNLGEAPIERHPSGWRLRDDLYALVVRRVPSQPAQGEGMLVK